MHLRRYHILVADEDDESLTRFVKLFRRRDHVVAGAPTVEEAHWWLATWPVDLIVASARFGSSTGAQLILGARAVQPEVTGLIVGPPSELPDAAEARRHRLHLLADGAKAADVLAAAESCLGAMTRRQRWPRKAIGNPVPVRIGTAAGKLMDVSYGGLKFELPDEPCVLRSPVEIDVPRADLRLQAEIVWSRRAEGATCVFGAAVTAHAPATEWRAFVDRLA